MRGYADTALGQVHFVAEGEGVPLLLLPQAGRSSRMFADLIPLLSPSYRVVALDLPGFGSSDPLPPGTTVEMLADCVESVAGSLALGPVHVYGLHTGNKIATALAVRSPQAVASIVLSGQSHSIIPDRAARNAAIRAIVERDIAPVADEASGRAWAWAKAFRKLTGLWWAPEIAAAGFSDTATRRARNRLLDEMTAAGARELYAANFAYDLGADLPRISVPLMVIEIATAAEDTVIGRQTDAIRELCPRAVLAAIEEPDGPSTLEGREAELARLLTGFLAKQPLERSA